MADIGAFELLAGGGSNDVDALPAIFSFTAYDASITYGGDSDYLTYTELDSGTILTVATSRVTFSNKTPGALDSVYKFKSTGFYSGDFVHEFEFRIDSTPGNGSLIVLWALANTVADFDDIRDALGNALYVHYYTGSSGGASFYLKELHGAVVNQVSSTDDPISFDTTYYARVTQDSGALRFYVFSNSARSTAVTLGATTDYLELTLDDSAFSFSTLVAMGTEGTGTPTATISGWVQNFAYGFQTTTNIEALPAIFSWKAYDALIDRGEFAAPAFLAGQRKPTSYVRIVGLGCSRTYGMAPCTADGAAGSECYNTLITCQDLDNYLAQQKLYWFSTPTQDLLPIETSTQASDVIPAIQSIGYTPSKIEIGKGLSARSTIDITISDFSHHDRRVDPYPDNRSYDATTQGSFWGRWLARNPYYENWRIESYRGFYDAAAGILSQEQRAYLITSIKRDGNKVTIKASDPLVRSRESYYPSKTNPVLSTALTDTQVNFFQVTGDATQYASAGYVNIGGEVIAYNSIVGQSFQSLTRGAFGTEASTHAIGDDVQRCEAIDTNAISLIKTLLLHAGINTVWWESDWSDLISGDASDYQATGLIWEPTKVQDLLDSICKEFSLLLYWDDESQVIRIKIIKPPTGTLTELTDEGHLLANSIKVTDAPEERVTQVWLKYNPADETSEDDTNYKNMLVQTVADNRYSSTKILRIKSRWLKSEPLVLATASRLLNRYKDTPKRIRFRLDPQHGETIKLADEVLLNTVHLQDVSGARFLYQAQIIYKRFINNCFEFEALTSQYGTSVRLPDDPTAAGGLYAVIAPDGTVDYTSATDQQKLDYGWIANSDGLMSDGDPPYLIL